MVIVWIEINNEIIVKLKIKVEKFINTKLALENHFLALTLNIRNWLKYPKHRVVG